MMPECIVKDCTSFATYYVATASEEPVAMCEDHEQEYASIISQGLTHDEAVSELKNG